MTSAQLVMLGSVLTCLGAILGYYARQSIARRKIGTIEEKLHQKIQHAQQEADQIIEKAKVQARQLLEKTKAYEEKKRQELIKEEKLLLKRSTLLDEKFARIEAKSRELEARAEQLKIIKANLDQKELEIQRRLEQIAQLSKEQAKKELFETIEKEHHQEILTRIRKLELEGWERFDKRAKEILATAIQRLATSTTQEITTTTIALPNDEIKGRIIGKEGRNIRTLERLTGVDILLDETPEVVVISSYDPVRRQIAKVALQRLILDGRIQPARIEEEVKKAEEELDLQMKEAGEQAVYETGVVGLDPRLIKVLGRLKFRTSYGQNVLLHSIEVSHLAGALAAEIGGDIKVAKKAGLLHDIGKALDHQVEGSHVNIGIKILEKFGVEKEVIDAMKSHHGEYEPVSLEAVIVTVADAISGARPGARKDTLENYLKRIEELEKVAQKFQGVEKAWALQAGRELRVFVKPEEIDDLQAHHLAKNIAKEIEQELKYPGEIKITLIREKRIIEYAR